jgi:SAM-dependent methyltransferase
VIDGGCLPRPHLVERAVLGLFRRFPPRTTIFKDPGPRPLEEYEDERAFGFHRYFRPGTDLISARDVLDLGCGYGGRPIRFLEVGARSVCGIEITESMVQHAERFAAERGADGARFLVGTGERIPCPDDSFDVVVMNDVMEHVIDPQGVIAECARVLRPGGRLALVLPPYYSFQAGSHLHGYATRVPGLNLAVPTRVLKGAALRRFAELGIDHRPFLREEPSDKLWNQNGLTVRAFDAMVAESPFRVEQRRLIGYLDHRLSDHSGRAAAIRMPVFWAAEAAAAAPLLREVAASRVAAILHLPGGPA